MSKVAPEFGLSGNGLAKLCRREGILVPGRGYWAKLAHGKRVKIPRVPPAANGREALTIEATASNRSALEDGMAEDLATLIRAERNAPEPIPFPKSPKPHGVVESWPKPQKPPYGVPCCTPEGESRRRRIASVLFREIERRGGKVLPNEERPNDSHRFDIRFSNEKIKVSFRERLSMVKVPPDPNRLYSYERTEWHPTGRMRLRFENYFDVPIRREWNDSERKPLETRLREILIALFIAIWSERRRSERFQREAERQAVEEKRRRNRKERERREREAVQDLLAEAKAWENARRIREYVKAIRACGETNPVWIKWALKIADRLDPAKIH